jgi:hypothetical protein
MVLEFQLEERKNGLPGTRDIIRVKVLEVAISLKILWQDFKASNDWAVRIMCHEWLAVHLTPKLAHNLPTDHINKINIILHHTINPQRQ